MDLQYRLTVFVRNDEFRGERVPLLYNIPYCVTRGSLHLKLSEGLRENRVRFVAISSQEIVFQRNIKNLDDIKFKQ